MKASIITSVDLAHWHTGSNLIKLSSPLRRYDPATGAPLDYTHIIVWLKEPEFGGGFEVFPTDEEGHFLNDTMQSFGHGDATELEAALSSLGYEIEE